MNHWNSLVIVKNEYPELQICKLKKIILWNCVHRKIWFQLFDLFEGFPWTWVVSISGKLNWLFSNLKNDWHHVFNLIGERMPVQLIECRIDWIEFARKLMTNLTVYESTAKGIHQLHNAHIQCNIIQGSIHLLNDWKRKQSTPIKYLNRNIQYFTIWSIKSWQIMMRLHKKFTANIISKMPAQSLAILKTVYISKLHAKQVRMDLL